EDGIRDFHVTGVQTCALPILHAAGWAGCPGVELTAVVTAPGRSPARLAGEYGLRACDSLDELLDLVDVVDVCAPTDVHHQITVRAARAGRAVICEKPLARTPAQAEDMIATCREDRKSTRL